jgi:hypothetical protein
VYVIDLTHYLNPKGAAAPERGLSGKFADFVTTVVSRAVDAGLRLTGLTTLP